MNQISMNIAGWKCEVSLQKPFILKKIKYEGEKGYYEERRECVSQLNNNVEFWSNHKMI